jgi:hypothetical protein
VLLVAAAPASAGAPRRAGLVVWPARATLAAGTATSLHVANHTRSAVSLSLQTVGLALDLRGAPRVVRASAGTSMIALGRRRIVIAAGAVGTVVVHARRGRSLPAGDRPALVLVIARSAGGAGIGVQVRVGVPVEVRVPGLVRRRLVLGALHVHRRRIELRVRNAGNVDERIDGAALIVEVWRASRRLAVLRPRSRDLLPHARGILELRVPKPLHGRVRILVRPVRPAGAKRSYSTVL